MDSVLVEVPKSLFVERGSVEFVVELFNKPDSDRYVLDFSKHRMIDPFSLIYVGNSIAKFSGKMKLKGARVEVINYTHLTYHAHVGFFKAFHLDFGKAPGEAEGSGTYVPITIFDRYKVHERCKELCLEPGAFMEKEAKNLAKVLTQGTECELYYTLVYSIREILRNAIEHSCSSKIAFCAQYLPSKNRVHFSVLDDGVGIQKTLSKNPTLDIDTEFKYLVKATDPGVSGKIYKGQKRKPKGEWANSGYGLYMTRKIAEKGGRLFIGSGETGLVIKENVMTKSNAYIKGTVISLLFDTSKLSKLNSMLEEFKNEASKNGAKIPASPSSLGISLKS